MAHPPGQSFNGVAAIYEEYAKTLRGYVRYQVVERNLESIVAQPRLRVLDIGGGAGTDTAWLAKLGHSVTLLEPVLEQANAAQARFNFFLEDDERARITMIQGDMSALPDDAIDFDLVLVHGVAMYQPDPASFIAAAATKLRIGGQFSLVEKGYYGAEARAIRRGDHAQLDRLINEHRTLNHETLEAQAFKPEELETFLTDAGIEVDSWSGIRVITDEMFEDVVDLDAGTLAEIVEAEYHHGRNPGIRAQGQMLHFIGHKA